MTDISKEAVERSCAQYDFGLLTDQPMSDLCRKLLSRVERLEAALTEISSYPASDHPASEAIIISGFVVTAREALKGETTND